MTRLCRLCGERPVPPSRVVARDYRCARCRHRSPAQQRANRKYFTSEKGRAIQRRDNQRRIYAGEQYHSRAATAEQAQAINAHIKGRIRVALARFKNREEAEGAQAG